MNYEVTFLNHACFYFENKEEIIIVDPWFFGKVFDNSWALLKDTEMEPRTVKKIKHIFITHEHPDHLHWPTLSKIQQGSQEPITIYITNRRNKNVFKNLKKMGFNVIEMIPMHRQKVNDSFYFLQCLHIHDSAIVFEVDKKIHLNQNDCYLEDYHISLIKTLYPKIDYWWMQFSLAGYYSNRGDFEGLERARAFHLNLFSKYHTRLKPEITIPFASYIYFCKKYNSFLNKYTISLQELIENNPKINFSIPFYGETIDQNKNGQSLRKWQKVYKESFSEKLAPPKIVDDKEIKTKIDNWLRQITGNLPYDQVALNFFEDKRTFVIDFKNKNSFFTTKKMPLAATLTMEGLFCFAAFPWGADTLNITSCFDVLDQPSWRFLLELRDSFYVR